MSRPTPTDNSARTQYLLFCVTLPPILPEVLPAPQAGTTTGSQAGLVSGGDTLIGVANLETHILARAFLEARNVHWSVENASACVE